MNAIVDPNAPTLAVVESNPVPEGAQVGWFETADRMKLRYARFPKGEGAPKGTVCLLHGRTEFIEKYFETIADLQARGFAVATFDFRGQGGSQRVGAERRLGHVIAFDDYWEDLRAFHSSVLLPDCPAPYYLVGHSMGGLVALLAGARDRMMFERMLVSAPMVGLDKQPFGPVGMARLTGVASMLGLGRLPVARQEDKPPSEANFAGNPLTSDLTRFMRQVDVLNARPELMVGAPTVRWAHAAFSGMAEAQRDSFPNAVKIPVLMLAAARDEIVSTGAIEQLGLRMRSGRHAVIPGARHELFMENDAIRGQVLAAFDAFIGTAGD
ncbi:alpha/beta fold hydrolase [Devosia sp.]|uniref:alpha/beta fold hydrolase n=1 Tax=Devosia sp. TaxID=1871048 RepID=UPI003A8F5C85